MVLLFSDNFGSSSGRRGHFWARSFPYLFLLFYEASLRPPRRRGPSFCIDRKKAKSDQGCALDPDGQRRRSLKNGPFYAAQSAWTGVLRSAMIDVCLGGSMLGRAAGCGVGECLLPLGPDIARSLLKVGLIGCLRRILIPCGGKERAVGPLPTLPPQRPRRPKAGGAITPRRELLIAPQE